jgi:hypothetical protein
MRNAWPASVQRAVGINGGENGADYGLGLIGFAEEFGFVFNLTGGKGGRPIAPCFEPK